MIVFIRENYEICFACFKRLKWVCCNVF